MLPLFTVLVAALVLGPAACGDDDTSTDEGSGTTVANSQTADEGTATTAPTADEGTDTTAPAADDATGGTAADACTALPRETIQSIVGADPGEGELEHAASSTICRYYGDAQVTVEIDPGSDVATARVSIEAYGDECETIDDIGDEALFCTGGFPAQGLTGQVVWTDGDHIFYVVYNFGDETPTKDQVLELADALDA